MTQIVFKAHVPLAKSESSRDQRAPQLDRERTELALAHLGLADALAHRYWSSRSDWCDLQQVARLGLLKAAVRFRTDVAQNFVAFAVPTICGELKRHLRDHGWVVRPPRHVQDLRRELQRTAPQLAQQLGHEPSRKELAAALAVGIDAIDEALLSDSSAQPQSLDAAVAAGSALCERLGVEDAELARVEELASLHCVLRGLTAWEIALLSLRFHDELTQNEIAERLHISQMQVSRTLTALLAKLRRQLGDTA